MNAEAPMPTGDQPATHEDVRRWGWAHLVTVIVAAIGGSGGAIIFLLAFAGESRAQAVVAAQAIATVQGQRIDVVKGDVDAVKFRLEAIDAGVARQLDGIRTEVREATKRSEQRADAQEQMLREVLREVRRR